MYIYYTEILPSVTLMSSSTGIQSTVNPSVSSTGLPLQSTSIAPSTLTSKLAIPQSTASMAPLPSVTIITGSLAVDISTMVLTTLLPSPSGTGGPQNNGTDGGVIAGAVIVVLVILVAMVTVIVVILVVIKWRRSQSVSSELYHKAKAS